VLRADGTPAALGIRETFARAPELLAIDDPSPLVTVAVHRLLLAILHRAHDGPRTIEAWETIWAPGHFGDPVGTYLKRVADRFDLFDAAHPFGQVAGLPPKLAKPVAVLIPERASERNNAQTIERIVRLRWSAPISVAVIVDQG
jgi:CRISPR system Cascade subunit CasA